MSFIQELKIRKEHYMGMPGSIEQIRSNFHICNIINNEGKQFCVAYGTCLLIRTALTLSCISFTGGD